MLKLISSLPSRTLVSTLALASSSQIKQARQVTTTAKTSLKLSVPHQAGGLQEALKFFWKNGVNMTRLESRPNRWNTDYDFYVDVQGASNDAKVQNLLKDLRANYPTVTILESKKVPWFPRRLKDLDQVANEVLDAGDELQADHPGFSDLTYRKRRTELAKIALDYRQGQPIPRIKYTPEELGAWKQVYTKLTPLLDKYACREHVRLFPLLVQNCGYRPDNIPQLQDISDYLKECTGFTIRPVAGLLSSRNFLYGLAFRVFFSTQYIRHHTKPLYTPEPDVCHELLGHAPLFADQDFADFSQEIGLASIGATDEQITQLARCYWFSVEFGLCYQNGERKAYGAGLLSSFGELEYAMSDKPTIKPWDPFQAAKMDYPITTYQPVYWAAESFESAKQKMQEFGDSLARPFNVRYDPYTQTIEVDRNLIVDKPAPIVKPKLMTYE